MNKKRLYFVLSLFLFKSGLFLLLNSKFNITGAVVGISISSSLSSNLGAFLLFILGMFFMIEGTLEEKVEKDPMKHLRKYVSKYHGDYINLITYVVDKLAAAKPIMGFKSTPAKRKEMRELKHLAGMIANKYEGIGKKDVYEIISEDLHKEKRKYGRHGR